MTAEICLRTTLQVVFVQRVQAAKSPFTCPAWRKRGPWSRMTSFVVVRLWRMTNWVLLVWRAKRSQSPEMLGSHSQSAVLTPAGGLLRVCVSAL